MGSSSDEEDDFLPEIEVQNLELWSESGLLTSDLSEVKYITHDDEEDEEARFEVWKIVCDQEKELHIQCCSNEQIRFANPSNDYKRVRQTNPKV